MEKDSLNYSDSYENGNSAEEYTEQEETLIQESDMITDEEVDLQDERQELTALSRKQFKRGMIIMVASLVITLLCAVTGSVMESLYHTNPIQSQLDTIVKICSYAFYLGLFFIIQYYITRRKIP